MWSDVACQNKSQSPDNEQQNRILYIAEAFNDLLSLIERLAICSAKHRHRELGYKSPRGGIPPAKFGIMRRLGTAAARANAHHVLDALRHVGPAACALAHARRAGGRSYGSARAACDDEDYFRTNSGFCGFGRDARFRTGTA